LAIPYIISPRNTKILKPNFTLSWNRVRSSRFYDVTIRNNGDLVWQRDTTSTNILYEKDWSLQPNTPYLLVVEAMNGRSSYEEIEKGAVNLGFEILDESKIEEIEQAIYKLEDLGLPPEAETLALAHLYIGAELRLEAIEQLKSLIDQGNRNPAIHRTLGDVYAAIGLNALAEKVYLEAFQLANSTQDIEEQAAAAIGLAETYEILANYREAHSWVIEGLQRYQQLDDSDQVYELVEMLERLSELI
jgi:tetratricopeptide (TPR) repeat protein